MGKRTIIRIYRNKENPNKYLEVHNDGYYHKMASRIPQKVVFFGVGKR